jgi:hypothetical protein
MLKNVAYHISLKKYLKNYKFIRTYDSEEGNDEYFNRQKFEYRFIQLTTLIDISIKAN